MFSTENNIPVFTAAGFSSANTASICRRSILGEHGSAAKTCFGFCAVRQAIALVPWTPKRGKRFQIGLNARAAAAVRAGDGERNGQFFAF